MSDNAIATTPAFSLDDLKKRIADGVQASFGMLMPADAFGAMVEAAITEFFNTKHMLTVKEVDHPDDARRESYNRRKLNQIQAPMTMFEYQVYQSLQPIINGLIKTWLTENDAKLKAKITEVLAGADINRPLNESILEAAQLMTATNTLHSIQMAQNSINSSMREQLQRAGVPGF